MNGIELVISGKFVKKAQVRSEWDVPVRDPEVVLERLRKEGRKADIFTFIQRLPESRPKYSYPMQWDNVAAIPITDYQTWLMKQIHRNSRNKLKKAEKEGVRVEQVGCDDELFKRIKEIQDECPVRQGSRFGHYQEDLAKVRKGHGTFNDRAIWLGAFFREEMIGFLKVVPTEGYARVMGILTKTCYNEKAPMNALIAQAVAACAERGIPYLVYAKYSYGNAQSDTLIEFKANNGFEHILLPRYFVPLTPIGRAALKAGYPRRLRDILPKQIVQSIRGVREKYVLWQYRDWFKERERCEAHAAVVPVTANN